MKLWKRAAGALKDQKSIWLATVSRRSVYRNPDLEAAIIRATSHDESFVDYKNVQRVFCWVRTSPTYLKPLVHAISARMGRTGSWAVALKGLMLMHGVFCCKIPAVQRIGRLPFDLSNFSDSHLSSEKGWGYNTFVRSYFTFLDQKSALLCSTRKDDQLLMVQELQSLLDLLLKIKPSLQGGEGMRRAGLVLEAMDCIIIEIFDVYSKICTLIARIFSHIIYEDSTSRAEASTALSVLNQANRQAEELSHFFELCSSLGVLNASEFPKVEQVPMDDIEEVERLVNERKQKPAEDDHNGCTAIVVRETVGPIIPHVGQQKFLTTIVTDKWEVFEDDGYLIDHNVKGLELVPASPIAAFSNNLHVQTYKEEIPDLITF